MSVYVPPETYLGGVVGNVARKAATALVTNSTNSLFTVSGGLVLVTALVGQVTTAIPNTASLTGKLVHTPSGGSAGDLTAATSLTNNALGTFYSIGTGVAADDMTEQATGGSTTVSVTYAPTPGRPLVLGTGVIGITISNHTVTPGAVKWYCTWIPLDSGAAVA